LTIASISDVGAAHDAGRFWTGYMRRGSPTQAVGGWADMSYGAGTPVANYYASAPGAAAVLSGNEGIYAGPPVNDAGYKKYLQKTTILPPATSIGQATLMTLDVVMFYPFIDGDGGYQELTNAVEIPRYSGEGCRIMAVGQGAGTAIGTMTITYTNSAGVAGRTSATTAICGTLAAGLLWSNDIGGTAMVPSAPFVTLQRGDTGVRSIEAIDLPAGIGGIFALAIVKPLGVIPIMEATTNPHEIDYMRERMIFSGIEDGAYVSMICRATVAAAPTTMHAEHTFVWG